MAGSAPFWGGKQTIPLPDRSTAPPSPITHSSVRLPFQPCTYTWGLDRGVKPKCQVRLDENDVRGRRMEARSSNLVSGPAS